MKEFIIEYWLEGVFSMVLSVLAFYIKCIKKKLDEQNAIKNGVIAMLHDRLFQSGMYFITKGEIGLSELRNIEHLYNAYHELGGNGTGTEIYERVKELKIVK